MSASEHASRRAGAAAAAAASEMVPINSGKKCRKRSTGRQNADPSPPVSRVPEICSEDSVDRPGFDATKTGDGGGGVRNSSRPPDVPPGPLPRDGNGQLPLLQSRGGIDADEAFGSPELALSSYLKLHPVLSLESTSFQTLQLVADLVEGTSIPTKELEIVPKPHDDSYLRCELPRFPIRTHHTRLQACWKITF